VRGSSGKLNIALSELPDFTCLPGEGALHRGAISISPSIDYIERAYDEAKYGQFAKQPYIDMIIPSMIDRDMAPVGHHVMSCFVQYAPYDIEGGWDDQKRDAFGETVISTIERYAPNIRRAIVGKQVITPADIERIAGITGGNIFHGELLLHQLFFLRPAAQWADFRTPLSATTSAGPARTRARRDGRGRQARGRSGAARWLLSATTRSSSARATTAWSPRISSPRTDARRWCWSGAPRPGGQLAPAAFSDGTRFDPLHAGRAAPARHRARARPRQARARGSRRAGNSPTCRCCPMAGRLALVAEPDHARHARGAQAPLRPRRRALARIRALSCGAPRVSSMSPIAPRCRACPNVSWVREGAPLAALAWRLRRLGRRDMFRFIRALSMSALEFTDEWFESEPVKAAVAALAIHGHTLGSMSAGTGYTLIHNWLNRGGLAHAPVPAGSASVSAALVAALQAQGARCAPRTEVERVLVDRQRATGVRLAGGEELESAAGAVRRRPAPQPARPWSARASCRRNSSGRRRASACAAPWPRCMRSPTAGTALPEGTLVLAPTSSTSSARSTPRSTARSRGAVPGGHHRRQRGVDPLPVRAVCAAERDWNEARARVERLAIDDAQADVPGARGAPSASSARSRPRELESEYGAAEGDLNHGQLILDQMFFMRPIPGWSDHRTPVDGFWLCGSGGHGGGGISGACGRNAARAALREVPRMSVSEGKSPQMMGPWMCTALVVGNIIGTGIFMLPVALAPLG
jgi:phytoene dehydrogenase-like protein